MDTKMRPEAQRDFTAVCEGIQACIVAAQSKPHAEAALLFAAAPFSALLRDLCERANPPALTGSAAQAVAELIESAKDVGRFRSDELKAGGSLPMLPVAVERRAALARDKAAVMALVREASEARAKLAAADATRAPSLDEILAGLPAGWRLYSLVPAYATRECGVLVRLDGSLRHYSGAGETLTAATLAACRQVPGWTAPMGGGK